MATFEKRIENLERKTRLNLDLVTTIIREIIRPDMSVIGRMVKTRSVENPDLWEAEYFDGENNQVSPSVFSLGR